MKDGADIALPDTGVPVELDRIYASIRDLAEALGPNGVNKDGTLNHLLEAGAHALDGPGPARQRDDPPALRGRRDVRRGRRAAVRHRQRARAVHRHPGRPTTSWSGPSSRTWPASRRRWSPSAPRSRRRWQRWPTRSAPSRRFVQDNRKALVTDVEKLTRVMKTINSERDSIDTALDGRAGRDQQPDAGLQRSSPGTIGSRIGIQGHLWDADGFLCAIVQQSDMPQVSKDLACTIFKQLLEPVEDNVPRPLRREAGRAAGGPARRSRPGRPGRRPRAADPGAATSPTTTPTLTGLLGGGS